MKMKTTILLCLMLLGAVLRAQVIPVTIIETWPEVVCAGDTVEAHFVTNAAVAPNQTFQVAVRLDHANVTVADTIFTGVLADLAVVDTIYVGIVYSVKMRVPVYCPVGTWYASGNVFSPRQVSMIVKQCEEASAATPTIIASSRDTVCPGDTICVTVVNPSHNPFALSIGGPTTIYWWIIYHTIFNDTMVVCQVVPDLNDPGTGYLGLSTQFPLQEDPNWPVVYWCANWPTGDCDFNVNGMDSICSGATVTYSAIGNAQYYEWKIGATVIQYGEEPYLDFPNNMPVGTFTGAGNYTITVSGSTGTCVTTETIVIHVLDCGPVGMKESAVEYSVEYFNLYGEKTPFKPNELMIEKRGFRFKKVIKQE